MTELEALRARVAHLESILSLSFDAIAAVDADCRYVDANPAACALFGGPKKQITRERMLESRRVRLNSYRRKDRTALWARILTDIVKSERSSMADGDNRQYVGAMRTLSLFEFRTGAGR